MLQKSAPNITDENVYDVYYELIKNSNNQTCK